ncbi:hypothetical protein KR018_001582 [Drosophila ironensis]|nr:hypothetical protein KR018_001582 [Drosophila ironensis]
MRPEQLRLLLALISTSLQKAELAEHWIPLAALPYPKDVGAALLLVQCQEAVASELPPGEEKADSFGPLADALLQCHFEGKWLGPVGGKEEQQALLLARSLQLLQWILGRKPDLALARASDLVGLILCYMQFGTEGHQQAPPRRVPPAQQSGAYGEGHEEDNDGQQVVKGRPGGRMNKVRKMRSLARQRRQAENSLDQGNCRERLLDFGSLTTGESGETCHASDSAELQAGARQLRHLQAKVRIAAMHLLGALAKHLPRRNLYGYWHVLFPSTESGTSGQRHLLMVALADGNMRCRSVALQQAAQVLYGSKVFLNQACSTGPTNYTSFAMGLASSVLCSYRVLSSILEREFAPPVLTQCLKCLAVLVQATPFDHLQMGFVYEFVRHVKKLAKNGDTTVIVAALLVMEMMLSKTRLTPEMATVVGLAPKEWNRPLDEEIVDLDILDSDAELEIEDEEEPEETNMPHQPGLAGQQQGMHHLSTFPSIPRNSWLLRQLLRHLESLGSGTSLRIQCYQLLQTMATHIGLLRGNQGRLARVLSAGLRDPASDVRLYAARCLDSVGYQLGRLTPEYCEKEMQLAFWQTLQPAVYEAYVEDASSSLKCALIDSLSTMGVFTFERLPGGQRYALLAHLSGVASDDRQETLVRAAALRAMAVCVQHPSLKADLVFVENAAELTLHLVGDANLLVRTKTSWALGNISDALITCVEDQTERTSEELLRRLIESAMKLSHDNDKVKANAVRSLGNLLQVLQMQPSDNHEQMPQAMTRLLECLRSPGSAKVKWNACHAMGNLVKHRALFDNSNLANLLFPALSQLMVSHPNFKVRINATAVLLQVNHRQDLGDHLLLVWRSLMEAFERSNTLESYEEYNHRDSLQQQLCHAMANLLSMARSAELPQLRDIIERNFLQTVRATWRRVAFRVVPEQSAPLFTCTPMLEKRLQVYATSGPLDPHRSAVEFFAYILKLD